MFSIKTAKEWQKSLVSPVLIKPTWSKKLHYDDKMPVNTVKHTESCSKQPPFPFSMSLQVPDRADMRRKRRERGESIRACGECGCTYSERGLSSG